jgi:phage gp29-like protein
MAEETKTASQNPYENKEHFATRQRANEFLHFLRTLPDPDPILQKMGKSVLVLRELLIDSHMESVWSVRCSAVSGGEWFIEAGSEGKREQEAAEAFQKQLSSLDMPHIIEEMMGSVAYGFSPHEIIWRADAGLWGIADIVGKPQEWFKFDQNNRLIFSTNAVSIEELPEHRFLLLQHRASYINPYGDKAFSRCFWPVTFKKNGFRWWTVFVEKYGGAFMYGKYPTNADSQFKHELLSALELMVSDAVAIAPEGSEITIDSLANKGSVNNIHAEYISAANTEISKAILGQTLTTEIGDKGSYAAAQAHNLVREDLARADRHRISACFNRLAAVYTLYNFGAAVVAPRFEFIKDEDLQVERAERDTKLFAVGWRPKKSYVAREYGIPEEDFELIENSTKAAGKETGFSRQSGNLSGCGCEKSPKKKSLFQLLFSTKEEKERLKDTRLMNEFKTMMIEQGQEGIDKLLDHYVDALGMVDSYKEAEAALNKACGKHSLEDIAHTIGEVRYAAGGIGGSHE